MCVNLELYSQTKIKHSKFIGKLKKKKIQTLTNATFININCL